MNRHMLKALLPTVAGVLLVGVALYTLWLPQVQSVLVDTKISMVRSMAQTAWSVLDELQQRVERGEMTVAQAQERGKDFIRSMRYGDGGRNYFWVFDYDGLTLVHPFRPDHVGNNLIDLRDKEGTLFIAQMIHLARENGEGLVTYYWQVTDDPS